ncbi:MAG: hypothetical protein A4E71_01397 [Smithella sp. PtaU1.Bin162]|nr:MAG: hypothetical protein A4E71_01397 [Smithella sp. PtaU1.Bin162]
MKKIILLLFTIGAAIFVIADSGWAFRCGNDLVTTGYNKVQVLSICGEPTNKEQSCLEHHRETGVCINKGEIWHYNCGDGDFFYALTFGENGILIKENTEGRGMGLSQCRGKLSK